MKELLRVARLLFVGRRSGLLLTDVQQTINSKIEISFVIRTFDSSLRNPHKSTPTLRYTVYIIYTINNNNNNNIHYQVNTEPVHHQSQPKPVNIKSECPVIRRSRTRKRPLSVITQMLQTWKQTVVVEGWKGSLHPPLLLLLVPVPVVLRIPVLLPRFPALRVIRTLPLQ